jgi:hypothetical protein
MKIISGGQTGVDRAALDVALKHGIECGGWCPVGRLDEFGRIPEGYPVKEVEQPMTGGRFPNPPGPAAAGETAAPSQVRRDSFAERTCQNVNDSDATVIIYFDELSGGTEHTVRCAIDLQRPHLLIDAAKVSADCAAELIADFVSGHKIATLNVAGPRESDWKGGYDYTFRALDIFVSKRQAE